MQEKNTEMYKFNIKLKQFRKALGETQATISNKLGETQASYSRYESGKNAPSYTFLYKLRSVFNANLDYFLFEDETEMFTHECTCQTSNVVKEDALNYNKLKELEEENERLKAALIKLATSPQN